LELRREHLGEDHDDTLRSWSNLSVFLRSRGKHTEAVAIQRRILERREAKFGPGHPQVLTVLGNLASSLFAAGEFADAKSTAETLVTRSRHKFGDEHEQTIDALYRLGFVERESGDPQAALARFERIVELADQVLPQTSSDRGYYRVEWGDTLRACDQYARAEEELRRGYEGLRSTLGIEHAYTRNAVRILGELYAEWDQPDRAAEFRELHQRNTGEAQKKNEPSKGDSS
ncbi:MAG: tetratricopeptide repeat protein, partial [Planctomycetota bacterium]